MLTARQAAEYCGVSKSFFESHVRPFVAIIDLKQPRSTQPMPRWLVSDLDTYLLTRRSERHLL